LHAGAPQNFWHACGNQDPGWSQLSQETGLTVMKGFAEETIEVLGDRATSICHATLHVRRPIGGVEADIESFMRFFDLLERRDGRWAIAKRTGVYEKDRLTAVDPKGFPGGFWDGIDLAQFPPAKRFLCFAQVKNGTKPNVNFISVNSPEEKMLYVDARRWLSGV
jgi:hypothetical protein